MKKKLFDFKRKNKLNRHPKIGYVIIREDLHSPVIQTQVIDILEYLSGFSKYNLQIIWFYRIDYIWKFRNVTNSVIQQLLDQDIKVVKIPFVSGRFPVNWYMIPLILPQWLLGLLWVKLRYGIQILHCRSYHAGLAAACFNTVTKTQFIFDPRSPFPEEQVAAGKWKQDGLNYCVWKQMEEWVIKRSCLTIATSNAFANELTHSYNHSRIVVLPNNVTFESNKNVSGISPFKNEQDSVFLCYVGSLGHWNKTSTYVEFIRCLKEQGLLYFKILFVVPKQSIPELMKELRFSNIDTSNIFVKSLPHNEVLNAISSCTAGLQLMDTRDVRLSIKVVEYLAAGIPILVSENVVGAAEIVRKYGVGFVLDSNLGNLKDAIIFLNNVETEKETWREKCWSVAREYFSTESVAKQLSHLYDNILISYTITE